MQTQAITDAMRTFSYLGATGTISSPAVGQLLKNGDPGHDFAVAGTALPCDRPSMWVCQFSNLNGNSWTSCGIISNQAPVVLSYNDATSYGCSTTGHEYKLPALGNAQTGDEWIFRYDPVARNLSAISKRTRHKVTAQRTEAAAVPAYVHFNIYEQNNSAAVRNATLEEVQLFNSL